MAPQPLKEEHLLTGLLESTNEWYAIAKISGVKATESIRKQFGLDYVSLMPTNLYGSFDNFDLETSHVLPAMMRKFHEAKLQGNKDVTLWGSGTPMREFLHVDDLANAVSFAINQKLPENLYNVGFGSDLTIKDLAVKIKKIIGHTGDIIWDTSKPDGTPRKWLDSSKLRNLGWSPSIDLDNGIQRTYNWFSENQGAIKEVKITEK
jgi:GDP-L-fucose synthase